jgi:tyrosine phenol-lyase
MRQHSWAEPWRIKVVEPLRITSRAERERAIRDAGYNTFLLRSDDVYIDLLTDSGTSAMSDRQWAGMMLGDEAYAGSRNFYHRQEAVERHYGYPELIPTHQGRGAEHLLSRVLVQPGQLVPSNLYFTTSRVHAELAGGVWASVSIREAEQPRSTHPFKGNIDLDRLEELLRLHGRDGIAFVRFEACLNMAGGQPFSMANLEAVRDLTRTYGVPLILDATRSSENALFVKRREAGFSELPFREILRQIAGHSDGAVFSSKKDHFVPIGGLVAVNDDELAA